MCPSASDLAGAVWAEATGARLEPTALSGSGLVDAYPCTCTASRRSIACLTFYHWVCKGRHQSKGKNLIRKHVVHSFVITANPKVCKQLNFAKLTPPHF